MNICAQDGLIIIIVYFCLHVCMVMCVNMYYSAQECSTLLTKRVSLGIYKANP